MDEYIEREALYELLKDEDRCGYLDRLDITSVPAADVAPVRHGKWIVNGRLWECSICGETTNNTCMGEPRANYCPNCGADMRGEEE